ncbi:MAG: protein phosphatase 2C domain-containing protein [Oscillospiraceae bacterium]|nr:protein phosphatase 2C domain-containing protein [Oscillospiraceae bacterium]
MKQIMTAAASVNMGKKRENNEDNLYFNGEFLTEETREKSADFEAVCGDRRQYYAVCDGMGGEELGELASLTAVETLHKYADLLKYDDNDKWENIDEAWERCIREANGLICEAQKSRGADRIGTTLALLAVENNFAHLYNVGDSRIYLFRKGKLAQVSFDHTVVANSVKMGILTPEQARTHPHRNRLSQYVGIDPEEMVIEAHKSIMELRNKDIFVLCSDGLTDMLDDAEISGILKGASGPAGAVRRLMDEALSRNGRDNITIIVLAYKRTFW